MWTDWKYGDVVRYAETEWLAMFICGSPENEFTQLTTIQCDFNIMDETIHGPGKVWTWWCGGPWGNSWTLVDAA